MILDDAPRRIEAVQTRHGDVHKDHFRPVLRDQFKGLAAVSGLSHHLNAGETVEKRSQAGPHQPMIFGQEYAYRRHLTSATYASASAADTMARYRRS